MADVIKLIDSGRAMRNGYGVVFLAQANATGYSRCSPTIDSGMSESDLESLLDDRLDRPRYYTSVPSGLAY